MTPYVRLQKLWISASRLLASEVVRREPEDLEAPFLVTFIECFESFVLGREAAFACNIHNQEDFPDEIRK